MSRMSTPDSDRGPLVIVANPRAGGGRAAEAAARLSAIAKEAGRACETALTERPGHAVRIAREAAPKAAVVVALGGDGTVHEVVNGLRQAVLEGGGDPARAAALGAVPLGTGNDFVKMFGIPRDPEAAFRALLSGARRRIDLGRVTGAPLVPERATLARLLAGGPPEGSAPPSDAGLAHEWFANDFSTGLGANTIVTMLDPPLLLRLLPARIAYMLSGVWNGRRRPVPLSITLDGVPSPRALFHEAHVGNGRYCGGGAQFTPRALVDDGLLDAALFHTVSRLRNFWTMFTKVQGGTVDTGTGVDAARASRVEITSASPLAVYLDGDLRIAPLSGADGRARIRIEVAKGALDVLAPKAVSGGR